MLNFFKRQTAFINRADATRTIHCHLGAVAQDLGSVSGANDASDAQLARNDSRVTGAAAFVGHDGAGDFHNRFPIRVGDFRH